MSKDRPFKDNVIFTEEMVNAARERLQEKLAAMDKVEAMNAAEVGDDEHLNSFVDEDDEVNIDDLFPFSLAERDLVEQIGATVRKKMVWADPETLRKIAAFLYALERLPYTTPDLWLDLAITDRIDQSLFYVSVELDGQSFRLSTGGSEYSEEAGSDSYSETLFEIEAGGYREGSTKSLGDWLEIFTSASGTLEIQEDGVAFMTEPTSDDGWDRLEQYWELHGEEEDDW
jgi:hypothetical protein